MNFDDILKSGVEISSSGTTGPPKTVFRTPANLRACIDVAVSAQKLTQRSSVLTVTRMTHAGGLLAQTLPAHSIGANYKVQQFNAFTFLKDFEDYTHTFLAPAQMTALMRTKGFVDCDLSGKRILCGSDPVTWEMITAFVERGATVQPNWGMSEIGPITINITFDSLEKVHEYKNKMHTGTILGNTFYCDWKIENNLLLVKGPTSINDGWLNTFDQVISFNGVLYYQRRCSAVNALAH
jgi:acyl-CoA synthetase (AMP-forming)/AMP-acid ligase II